MNYLATGWFRKVIVLTVLIFLSLILSAYSYKHPNLPKMGNRVLLIIAEPFYYSFSSIQNYLVSKLEQYVLLQDLRQDNNELHKRVKLLENDNANLREAAIENKRLRKILAFKKKYQLNGQVANVIAINSSAEQQSLVVDLGSYSGVAIGQVVVSSGGLVGQVVNASLNSAQVMLITDALSSVDAMLQDERVRGIVSGMGRSKLSWDFIEQSHDLSVGDRVITSGRDGIYPKGLEVGVIAQTHSKKHDLFQQVLIKPKVKLQKLETVLILDVSSSDEES